MSIIMIPVDSAAGAAVERAQLAIKAAWVRLDLGDAAAACDAFSVAQAALSETIGTDDVCYSFMAVPGHVRALLEMGRPAEAESAAAQVPRYTSDGQGLLLSAGLAVALRAPDAEVLALLKMSIEAGCTCPAGSQATQIDTTRQVVWRHDKLDILSQLNVASNEQPEWREFLHRMAERDDVDVGGTDPPDPADLATPASPYGRGKRAQGEEADLAAWDEYRARIFAAVEQRLSDVAKSNHERLDQLLEQFEIDHPWRKGAALLDSSEEGEAPTVGAARKKGQKARLQDMTERLVRGVLDGKHGCFEHPAWQRVPRPRGGC
jgi:hypothetical protein